MSEKNWQQLFARLGLGIDNVRASVRARVQQKLHPEKRLHVICYRGFGTTSMQSFEGNVRGRVLKYKKATLSGTSGLWNNLRESYARFDTDEMPGVEVLGNIRNTTLTAHAVTDKNGHFTLNFQTDNAQIAAAKADVDITLPEHSDVHHDGHAVINIVHPEALFGVISDVDDTLLITQATSVLKMMRLTLLESPATRLAFPGVAEFYAALHAGKNPFFYVSSSPWNLYEFLADFMRLNEIVAGPLMLRDFGIDEDKFISGSHKEHKLEQIRCVLDRHPLMPFVLCGDSGQDDPEIYASVCDEYPGRIKAIYIRDVSDDWRDRTVQRLINKLARKGIDMLLVPDTLAAANHAATLGLIDTAALTQISYAVHNKISIDNPSSTQDY